MLREIKCFRYIRIYMKKYHDGPQTVQKGETALKLSHDGKEMRIILLAELGIHISRILGSDD